MSEPTLKTRLGIYSGANTTPKRNKPKKSHNGDHQQAVPWPRGDSSSSNSYEAEDSYQPSGHVTPSLLDRLGLKIDPPLPPRSLLERMELQDAGAEGTETGVADASEDSFISLDAVHTANGSGENGEIAVDDSSPARDAFSEEERALTPDVRPTKNLTQSRPSWNAGAPARTHATPPAKRDPPDTQDAGATYPELINGLTSEASAVNSVQPDSDNSFMTTHKSPEPLATNRPDDPDVPMPFVQLGPATDASNGQNRPSLSLQACIGRTLQSVVLHNAKLREKSGAIDLEKVQSKLDIIVTENVCESFGAQMRKVKKELDAKQAGRQTEEVMARAKHELLNGFGDKSGVGDSRDDTWLNRRDSHSLLPSTSILPTPPPSELLTAENIDKPPPREPRAMRGAYSPPPLPSLKGKEKAVDPGEEDAHSARDRRDNYSRLSLRAEPMQKASSDWLPRRRASVSSARSFGSHRRGITEDELPRYRSPPRTRINRSPQDRKGSLRSSRSPVRTNYSHSPGRSRRLSPRARSRSSRSRSRPRRADSHTHSFNSRRPPSRSVSRSPPPSASYLNGFRPRSSHKSRSRSTVRALSRQRTFSGKYPPHRSRSRSPLRHAPEKRPFVRSPSPVRGRRGDSILGRRSRSPLPIKRKLTHQSPRSRSPFNGNRRSPSYGPDLLPRGRPPARNGPYSTPGQNPGRGYEDSPTQLCSPFKPQPPPSAHAREPSPAQPSPPPNPCDNVPGLWFVKVGANAPKVLEGRFVVEPGFAVTWGLPPPRSTSTLPEQSKLSVLLLCLPTEAVSALSSELLPTNPTAETMATAVARLPTAWPQDGTLFVDMNEQGKGGKTWLPRDLDPASPLDITNYIQPGLNVIRFIQLAGMMERTFILYASIREPTNTIPDPVSQMFENSAPIRSDEPLFSFSPSVVVSQFL